MIPGLTSHLWQSTVFAAAAALLTLAFRKNRAKVRFWLWLSASLKFFIPFALLMSLGSQIHWTPAAHQMAAQIATPAVAFAVEYVAQPFSGTVFAVPPAQGVEWKLFLIPGVWACGFLAIIVIRLRLWMRVRSAVNASTVLEMPSAVEVRSAPGLLEPGVVGLLKPVLLLPEGIEDRLTESQLEAVLAHELCHVRRRDNLFAAIHMIVEAVFWFHPLVWWIGARMVEERERACDEDVLSLGNQPRIYADAILNVCKLYVESPLVCVAGVTGSDIKTRIEAIMTNRMGQTLNRAKKLLLAGAGFVAVAGPVLIGLVAGLGQIPAIHAQFPVRFPPSADVAVSTLAQAIPAVQASPASAATESTPATPATPASAATPATPGIIRYQDRRLVAMLFDFATMTSDDQVRARMAGINFVQKQLQPVDLVCVMLATTSRPVQIAQDFTDSPSALESAIQNLPLGSGSVSGANVGLANISTAAKMLAGFPEKKALIYFSSALAKDGTASFNGSDLVTVVNGAKQANVALFPIDVSAGSVSLPVQNAFTATPASANSTGPMVINGTTSFGRGPAPPSVPAGVSQEEYDRRVAYAQSKFGSLTGAMSRSYIRYGAPDQIDTPTSGTAQIWRYNYVEDFHGGAAFEFAGNSPMAGRIVYPPAEATFTGQAGDVAQLAPLSEALAQEMKSKGKSADMGPIANLPGHVTVQVYPAAPGSAAAAGRRFVPVSIPLGSMSGPVDIIGQVKKRLDTGAPGAVKAQVRDSISVAGATYQSGFTLPPGMYVMNFLVKEETTGRTFGETINVDVQ